MSIKRSLKLVEEVFHILRNVLLLIPVNFFVSCLPRDRNLWVFTSNPAQYNDNSRLFFEWINQNHEEIEAVWLSHSEDVVRRIRNEKRAAFNWRSLCAYLKFLRAGKVFTSYNAGRAFPSFLMGGTDWYDLWHGMPLKQIGYSHDKWEQKFYSGTKAEKFISDVSLTISRLRGRNEQKMHRTVVNSPFFIPFLTEAFGLSEKDMLETGSPRCDALFSGRREPLLGDLRKNLPDCKIILYMPTFRSSRATGGIFAPFSEKYGFNETELEKALERNNCVLLYKAHAQDLRKKDKLRDAHSRFREISDNDYDELYNFVGQVDMLVTDYSSIYFDFLAIKKPVILCPFDYDEYLEYSSPLWFDYFENMEGAKARDWHEFIRILDEKSYYPVSEETRMKFAEYLDGNCCQKLFDVIMAIDKKR